MATVSVIACGATFFWWLHEMATAGAHRPEELQDHAVGWCAALVLGAFICELVAGAGAVAVLATVLAGMAVAAVAHSLAVDGCELRRRADLLEAHLKDVQRIVASAQRADVAQAQLVQATHQTVENIRRSLGRRA